MADVKTESLKAVDNITKPLVSTSTSNNSNMTVEKLPGHQPVSKNKTAVKESSSETQNAPTSPKKSDARNSPTTKTPSGPQPPKQQSQQQAKSKGNPWHKNPSPTVATTGGKKAPEGGENSSSGAGSSSPPQEDLGSSRSIRIPKDEVCLYLSVSMSVYV